MQDIKNMSAKEIRDQLTGKQADDLYRLLWIEYVIEDIMHLLESENLSDEECEAIACAAANDFVYEGEYDCERSYWDNLYALIEKHNK